MPPNNEASIVVIWSQQQNEEKIPLAGEGVKEESSHKEAATATPLYQFWPCLCPYRRRVSKSCTWFICLAPLSFSDVE
ncbi:hypothetical protein PVK06_019604 [Gossypium arboreum]|uniref:Uncharacterized protein n=1 Tax=Gossypium arboreum TaxID=29729 RepID=A0ABR0PKU0_GOSAR|nr:hypothetical protein PVK06_019604 [Gossypium arboreum]